MAEYLQKELKYKFPMPELTIKEIRTGGQRVELEQNLKEAVIEFVDFILMKEGIAHAGNCLTMSQILQYYLKIIYEVDAELINVNVKEGRKKINHYCLKLKDGSIIDRTSSQFNNMTKVYFGEMPNNYLTKN